MLPGVPRECYGLRMCVHVFQRANVQLIRPGQLTIDFHGIERKIQYSRWRRDHALANVCVENLCERRGIAEEIEGETLVRHRQTQGSLIFEYASYLPQPSNQVGNVFDHV